MTNPNRRREVIRSFLCGGILSGRFLGISILAMLMWTAYAQPTNVLIILPDDLSYQDFSYYNHLPAAPRTPNIDRLAGESVRLTDFHVSPTCSPTRAAIMTGRYNDGCGVWHTILGRYFLRANEVTMADVFKANDYRTALFSKWHLGDNYPFRPKDRGFEHVVMIHGGGIEQQHDYWGNRNTMPCTLYVDDRLVALTNENDEGIPGAFSTDFFTTRTMDYMKACAAGQQPFFAYLAYNVAHLPNDMPPDTRPGISAFTGTIENLDKNVGRLLKFLDTSGLADNTLLLFFTDNGMSSSMLRGGKASEYEGGHRVPCFVRWKAGGYAGTPASAREMPRLVSHIDLLPTLMDVLGLHDVTNRSPEVPMDGRSFKTLLDTNSSKADSIFGSRILVVDNQRSDELRKYKQACVMRDELDPAGNILHKWRLIITAKAESRELYDVQADVLQTNNLIHQPENSQMAKTLESAYEIWWREVSAHASEYSRPILGSAAEPVTCLYGHDWHTGGGVPWEQSMVAAGLNANGFNSVEFSRAGDYTFVLRRWPIEITDETTVTSQLRTPIVESKSTALTKGKALPIRSARIRIWNGDKTYDDERQDVKPDSGGATFTVRSLGAGPAMVQTWFYDASGRELCGAYYDYVSFAEAGGKPIVDSKSN